MATQLKSIVRFVNVAVGGVVAQPHGLNVRGTAVTPGLVLPGVGGAQFTVTADATNVTVTNTGLAIASLDVYVEYWHTFERTFGSNATTLTPTPFVANPASGLGTTTYQGNTVFVDAVYGDDATGQREGLPFLTVAAALAVALTGDAVIVRPGTYDLAAGLTIPTGVALASEVVGTATLRMLGVAGATTLVTMGLDSHLEGFTLQLTSAAHVNLIGIDFPGTTATTGHVRECDVIVDNSGAGAGSSDVTGVRSNGTGTAPAAQDNLHEVAVSVASTGNGTKRGLLIAGASTFHATIGHVTVSGAGGGTFIGIETNHAGATFVGTGLTITGVTADISQTLGSLQIEGATSLTNVNANGLGFQTLYNPTVMTFGDAGTLPNGTRYFYPGTNTGSTTPVRVRLPNATVVKSLALRAATAPGGIDTVTVTIQKNGVDTALVAALTGIQTSTVVSTISVGFAAGDDLSVKVVDTGATADLICVVELY